MRRRANCGLAPWAERSRVVVRIASRPAWATPRVEGRRRDALPGRFLVLRERPVMFQRYAGQLASVSNPRKWHGRCGYG